MIDGLKPYPATNDSGAPGLVEDPDSIKVSYQISFTCYFYKPMPVIPLDETRAEEGNRRVIGRDCWRKRLMTDTAAISIYLAGQHTGKSPIIDRNKTRQGYALRSILKPAGYFFVGSTR